MREEGRGKRKSALAEGACEGRYLEVWALPLLGCFWDDSARGQVLQRRARSSVEIN